MDNANISRDLELTTTVRPKDGSKRPVSPGNSVALFAFVFEIQTFSKIGQFLQTGIKTPA